MDSTDAAKELIHRTTEADDDYDRSWWSRTGSIAGLCLSWLGAVGCICAGAALLNRAAQNHHGWLTIGMFPRQRQFTPLFINIIITILTESMGLIHSTILRWALNDRLTFNSNLRLFIAAQDYWALCRASNFFRAGFLALCYCASSLVLTESPDSNVGQTLIDEMGFK